MTFKKDLEESQRLVLFLINWLTDCGYIAYELVGKKEQLMGDLVWYSDPKTPHYVEVKYDKMAKTSGNLCFELKNERGPSGIMKTASTEVYYVIPSNGSIDMLVFRTDVLKNYLKTSEDVTIKYGGDRKGFELALIKRSVVESNSVTKAIYNISSTKKYKKVK